MKKINKSTIYISAATLLIGVLIGSLFFGNGPEVSVEASSEQITNTIWTCSMHPQIRRNESGDCPICGMELIPLESSNDNLDPMAVSMSPIAMKLAQVQTLLVGQRNAKKAIRLNGKVQADERNLYTQSSHIPGRIEKLTVNFTGEFVAEGQEIAYIYSPELVNAQEELFEAKKIKGSQPALFDAAKEKLRNWKLTDKQIEQIIASDKALERFPILANVSGYVTKKMVNLGDYIKQGEAIYEIADLSKVWVLFDVYESEISWIKKGAFISYEIKSIPGKTFRAKVSYIDPVIDPKTRVAKARVEQNNKNFLLKPEMFASGTVQSEITTDQSSLIVPKTAVMWTGRRSVVYVMQNTGQNVSFVMREVMLGPELGESYVIDSGLQSGEEIAVYGTFSIDAAAQLAGKPSMMNPTGGKVSTGHNHSGGGNNEEMEMSSVDMEEEVMIDKSKIPAKIKSQLGVMVNSYLSLKDKLANDDTNILTDVKALQKSLKTVDMSLVMEDPHNASMDDIKSINKDLKLLSKAVNIEEQRTIFLTISKSLADATQKLGVEIMGDKALYLKFCPMANDNKGGYWLSIDEEIKNPYFGKKMHKCGEIKKQIN